MTSIYKWINTETNEQNENIKGTYEGKIFLRSSLSIFMSDKTPVSISRIKKSVKSQYLGSFCGQK